MLRRSLSFALLLTGCASFRTYHTPLTAAEGALAVPALVSTAEGMGLGAWGQRNTAQVELKSGARLYWGPYGDAFALQVALAGEVGEADREVRFREAKVEADQIWELAMQARQQSSVGAALVINPAAEPAPGGPSAPRPSAQPVTAGPAPQGGSAAGSSCRSGLDCGSGQFCKDRGGGVMVCMGHGGEGAPCSSAIDCTFGLFCRSGACRP